MSQRRCPGPWHRLTESCYHSKRNMVLKGGSLLKPRSFFFFFKDFIYLFLETGERREKEKERNVNVWLPLTCHPFGTGPATQVCAFTGNQTRDPLVHRPALNPISHTSQGDFLISQYFSVSGKSYLFFPYIFLWFTY